MVGSHRRLALLLVTTSAALATSASSVACGGLVENTDAGRTNLAAVPPSSSSSGGASSSGGTSSGGTISETALDGDFTVLAADATDLFATGASGRIVRVPKSGGTPVELYSGGGFQEGLAADDAFLYWTRLVSGEILRMPKTGGPAEVIAKGQVRPWGIAVDDTRVYWACADDVVTGPTAHPTGRIASLAKAGGTVQVLAPNEPAPSAITLDGDFVYFGDAASGYANAAIKRVPRSGGTVETIVSGRDDIKTIAVANGWVGWTEMDRFAQSKITGGAVLEIIPQPNVGALGYGMATNGNTFYFGVRADPVVDLMACDLGADTARTIAKGDFASNATRIVANAVVADASRVYWLDYFWSYQNPNASSLLRSAPH
jgi:hypothetical protein